MKIPSLKLTLLLAGAVLFNLIFWQEKIAINALIFDVFILGAVFYLYPAAFTKPVMKWLLLAHLITWGTLILHNTMLSKIAFCSTLMLVVVFTQYLHRSVWYAAASALGNYLLFVFSFAEDIQQVKKGGFRSPGFKKGFRFLIIPLLIATVFFVIYSLSNAVFQDMVNSVSIALERFFSRFFEWFNWQRFGFLMLGLFVSGGLLLKMRSNYFAENEARRQNELYRTKRDLKKWKETAMFDLLYLFMGRFANGMLALRNENTVGIISLVMLNLLLMFINVLDIIYVWFGFGYTANLNLTEFVHEGTGMLIFSIVLAVFVLLFFFRGNLNFYKKNKWLRWGAYCWLLQNAVLVVSVLFRDYYYIAKLGLAYKRIGVLVFLVMVLVGLITVFIKIHRRKTAYYLWRVNGWFAIVLLVAASCVHWDKTIAGYNLAHKKTIPVDVHFLLSLSDRTLPALEKHLDVLDNFKTPIYDMGGAQYGPGMTARAVFEMRKKTFFLKQQNYSWLSWNASDNFIKNKMSNPSVPLTFNR